MIIAGIIAEYNPFHEGHKYHIEETRKKTKADYIIVVMSGDYVQRGEPAVVDKYFRTQMALKGGADLILELPAVYACASAEYFSRAGVQILDKLGCVDYLSFGSEWAKTQDFEKIVSLLTKEPEEYKEYLKNELKKGNNFPTARSRALEKVFMEKHIQKNGNETSLKEPYLESLTQLKVLLEKPNHILGIEYMKALKTLHSNIKPITIQRKGSGYHEKEFSESFASATAIRMELKHFAKKSLAEQRQTIENLSRFLGEDAEGLIQKNSAGDFVCWQDFMPFLDYMMWMGEGIYDTNWPCRYFGMDEDMARRLMNEYCFGMDFSDLLQCLHTKRLTDTAWQRGLLHIVLQIKKMQCLKSASDIVTPYVRVLGFSKNAAPLLKKIRESTTIDIVQKPAKGRKLFKAGSMASNLYQMDIRVSDLYEQIAARKSNRKPISEWTRQQIIL